MSLVLRQRGLARFVAWAHERGLRQPQELTRQVLESYQRHLYLARSQRDGNPLGLRTQQQLIGAVRGWCKWLTREGHIPANPAADLEMPRMPRSLPRTLLSVDQVRQLIQQPNVEGLAASTATSTGTTTRTSSKTRTGGLRSLLCLPPHPALRSLQSR